MRSIGMWLYDNWATVITALVAVYGAGLSTVTFRAQRRRDRVSLKVSLSEAGVDGMFQPTLQLRAVNVGLRPIHLEEAAIILPNGEELIWGSRFASHGDLPCTLVGGRKYTATAMVNDVSLALMKKELGGSVKLRGRIIDETGTAYTSEPFRFRIREWVSKI